MYNEKILYTPLSQTKHSMLDLIEGDPRWDPSKDIPICPSELANEIIASIDIPKRDFWEQAQQYLDEEINIDSLKKKK